MSQINVIGKTKSNLADGKKWFAYSGLVSGDVSVPSTIELINIPNTGLRDAYVKIQPSYAQAVSTAGGEHLGILVKINDQEIFKSHSLVVSSAGSLSETIELFIPYQSKLEILSLNTSGNNTQERGVAVTGWFFG